jgi:hypothetical protein
MKLQFRIAILILIVGAVALGIYIAREATKPESRIIADERARIVRELAVARSKNDDQRARDIAQNIRFLDFQLALEHNKEEHPALAISILNSLIKDEEAVSPRRSRSYFDEAKLYNALAASYQLKGDAEAAKQADQKHEELFSRAMEMKKVDERQEGHRVGPSEK